jgi:hypothetical protein
LETGRGGVRPPPRSPAQFRFPGAAGIVFDFPRLCRRRRGIRLNTAEGKTTEWKSQSLRAYQRRTLAADALIAGTYLAGTNTRRVRRALFALFGGAVGKDTVSRVWRKVKNDWDAWNARSLADEDDRVWGSTYAPRSHECHISARIAPHQLHSPGETPTHFCFVNLEFEHAPGAVMQETRRASGLIPRRDIIVRLKPSTPGHPVLPTSSLSD